MDKLSLPTGGIGFERPPVTSREFVVREIGGVRRERTEAIEGSPFLDINPHATE